MARIEMFPCKPNTAGNCEAYYPRLDAEGKPNKGPGRHPANSYGDPALWGIVQKFRSKGMSPSCGNCRDGVHQMQFNVQGPIPEAYNGFFEVNLVEPMPQSIELGKSIFLHVDAVKCVHCDMVVRVGRRELYMKYICDSCKHGDA